MRRPAKLLVGHILRLDHELSIWLFPQRPTHDPTPAKLQDYSQVMPLSLRPNVGDIAASDLIGRWHIELAVQCVRGIDPFYCCSFLGMGEGLLAD